MNVISLIAHKLGDLLSFIYTWICIVSGFLPVICSVWLLILGDWQTVVLGLSGTICFFVLIGWVSFPFMTLSFFAVKQIDKGNKIIGFFFNAVSALCLVVILTAWCLWVFYYSIRLANMETYIPVLLLGYCVAILPIMERVEKADSDIGTIVTIFLQFSYLICIIGISFGLIALIDIYFLFIIIMLLALIIIGFMSLKKRRRYNYY